MSNAYADTVGGKPQEAEAAGACEQWIGRREPALEVCAKELAGVMHMAENLAWGKFLLLFQTP